MGMKIDLPIATNAIDSAGEILQTQNVDLSLVPMNSVFVNYEHNNDTPDDGNIGIVRYAKKIGSIQDCEDDRQRMYWNEVGLPFIYGIVELFDDVGHPGAVALAAAIRWFTKNNEKVKVGGSIEGLTLSREGNVLKRAVMKKLALTLAPCNKQCWLNVLHDDAADQYIRKFESDDISSYETLSVVLEDTYTSKDHLADLQASLQTLTKTLTAGMGNSAPGTRTQGTALAKETIDGKTKNHLKAIIRDWDKSKPLKEVIKAELPNLADSYVEHYVDAAHDFSLRKAQTDLFGEPQTLNISNSTNRHMDQHQKRMLIGLSPEAFAHLGGSRKLVNRQGDTVFHRGHELKDNEMEKSDISGLHPNLGAAHYYHVARDFFGMKDNVPATTYFYDHKGMGPHGATLHNKRAISALWDKADAHTPNHIADGSFARLALMDFITGTPRRGLTDLQIDEGNGKLQHINNTNAFTGLEMGHQFRIPTYVATANGGNVQIDTHTSNWIDKMQPSKLVTLLRRSKLSEKAIMCAVANLKHVKSMNELGERDLTAILCSHPLHGSPE